MSDQQDGGPDQSAEKTAAQAVAAARAGSAAAGDAQPGPAHDAVAASGSKPSSAVAWLSLLLGLALAGGALWLWPELQRTEAGFDQRLAALESAGRREQSDIDAVAGRLEESVDQVRSAAAAERERLATEVALLEGVVAGQAQELARFSASDRDSWLLAEAQYLLRLANQRLIMGGDTVAAAALLGSADKVLREIDDTRLHDVRGAVAADLAAVRAVPTVDVEGIYLRLAALAEQAGQLRIFELPEQPEPPELAPADDWRGRLRQGYEQALHKLSDYIIIRRRAEPVQALMDPQWEGLVRQNLRMLLEQAQVALLSGNQSLYVESLERAQHWVGEFTESDAAAAAAASRELRLLADLTIAVEMPDLARSLQALDEAVAQRLAQGGEE